MTYTPREFIRQSIIDWEGEFQNDPDDAGNYVTLKDGTTRLVGTMRGVTPSVLAAHRKIDQDAIDEATMSSVTLDEATDIGMSRFFVGTGFDRLPWGAATAALVDFAWGSGVHQAIKSMQRLVAAPGGADGNWRCTDRRQGQQCVTPVHHDWPACMTASGRTRSLRVGSRTGIGTPAAAVK